MVIDALMAWARERSAFYRHHRTQAPDDLSSLDDLAALLFIPADEHPRLSSFQDLTSHESEVSCFRSDYSLCEYTQLIGWV
jgi:phenylacetate-coenzyme A ligase PaaK-like adenylate-forming protein